jgi:hypothetical protein
MAMEPSSTRSAAIRLVWLAVPASRDGWSADSMAGASSLHCSGQYTQLAISLAGTITVYW